MGDEMKANTRPADDAAAAQAQDHVDLRPEEVEALAANEAEGGLAPDGEVPTEDPAAKEVAELKDRLLRTLAEMENLRRRTEREVEEARKYSVTGFARGLLEVADNLSRALASVPEQERQKDEFIKSLVQGVEMTERSLHGLLEKHQVKKVVPEKGQKFDHNRHQAMFEIPTSAYASGSVAEVLQPGYVIADRLLRPAMVGVAKAPPNATASPAPAAGATVDTTV